MFLVNSCNILSSDTLCYFLVADKLNIEIDFSTCQFEFYRFQFDFVQRTSRSLIMRFQSNNNNNNNNNNNYSSRSVGEKQKQHY